MTLREKIINVFDVYFPKEATDAEIVSELNRRGKFNIKSLVEIIFILVEEIERMGGEESLAKEVLVRADKLTKEVEALRKVKESKLELTGEKINIAPVIVSKKLKKTKIKI